MSIDEQTNRLFRIRRTIMHMLRDRGYVVGDGEIKMTKTEFIHKYGEEAKREDLIISKYKRNDPNERVRRC